MKIVGLTGGIGSGKSTVAREFENLGVPIFIADDESKRLLANEPYVIQAVENLLGSKSYYINEQGVKVPDKKYIASKVFNDKYLLSLLNEILHPAVRNYFNQWIADREAAYIIYEAAILLETNGHLICDQVILVTADKNERIRRVVDRDQVSREEVEARLSHQWTDIQRLQLSNFVIINEDIEKTKRFVSTIHEVLLKN